MPDKVTYAAPVGGQVLPGTQQLEPLGFAADYKEEWFQIKFYGDNGVIITVRWEGQEAKDLIAEMNSKDFTQPHLKKWLGQVAMTANKIPAGGTAT